MIRERFALVARFFVVLSIGLWLGGMAFFGAMAAPPLFALTRPGPIPAIGPQLVGAMLTRFSVLTYACALILLVGWAVDGWLLSDRRLSWKLQGAGSVVVLGLALYLGQVLLPQTVTQQDTMGPIYTKFVRKHALTSEETATKAVFDAEHERYKAVASVNLWLLMAILALVVARSGPLTPGFCHTRAIAANLGDGFDSDGFAAAMLLWQLLLVILLRPPGRLRPGLVAPGAKLRPRVGRAFNCWPVMSMGF